jgi:cytoskeletal protein CcmA (bactofilin family)
VISGELDGNADCANVEILAGGKMNGDLISANLIIESQAVFEGYSKIRVNESAPNVKSGFSIFSKSEQKEIKEIKE